MASQIPTSGPLSLKDLHDDFKKYPTLNPTNISLSDLVGDFLCESPTNQSMSSFHGATYLKPFIISTATGEDAEDTCNIPRPAFDNQTGKLGKGAALVYHNGNSTNPVLNDFVYASYKGLNSTSGASCTNSFLSLGFYRMDNGNVANLQSTGRVKGVTGC
tara:strand:+ start:481 stop:960 length:480 start_codon:yes stop_codon:yes gene_type:complete